jgi:hypothetical protein
MPTEVSSKLPNWGLRPVLRGELVFLFGEQAEHKAGETGATSEAGKQVRGVRWVRRVKRVRRARLTWADVACHESNGGNVRLSAAKGANGLVAIYEPTAP